MLRYVCGETTEEDVGPQAVEGAWALVRYFKLHAHRVYGLMDADSEVRKAKRVLEWVRRERRSSFTKRDVFEDVRNKADFPKIEGLDGPLKRLETHGYIRLLPRAARAPGTRGRPAGDRYEVNPRFPQ
jgi:hypothetical protein